MHIVEEEKTVVKQWKYKAVIKAVNTKIEMSTKRTKQENKKTNKIKSDCVNKLSNMGNQSFSLTSCNEQPE